MPQHDLSDNAARGGMLATLISAASQKAPPRAPLCWESDAVHPEPESTHGAAGSAWKLHNDLCVFSQYGRVLRDACKHNFFLNGAPATCVEGLEWFHGFAQPVEPLAGRSLQEVESFLKVCMQKAGTKSMGEAAFDAHRAIAKPDRNLTQFIVEHHFVGPLKQYELDVCAYMLAKPELTYNTWQAMYPLWQTQGLYFPVALGSLYMPTLHNWLPAEAHCTPVAFAFDACLQSLRFPSQDHTDALQRLVKAWDADSTGAADVLSGKLDRLAILMGVKSNGRQFDLPGVLARFVKRYPVSELGAPAADMHRQNYLAWKGLRDMIETTFPPSLLSAPLVRPRRETWGYARLTLALDTETKSGGPMPCLRFAQYDLEHVDPDRLPKNSVAYTYQPAFVKECMLHQTSQRIQDVLWRLGEIATSPHLATCMLRPDLALDGAADRPSVPEVLSKMAAKDRANSGPSGPLFESYTSFTDALEQGMPHPLTHYLPREEAVLFWRIDTPPRALLYVGPGHDVDPLATSTHHYEKVMVNWKGQQRHTGGILRVSSQAGEEAIGDALCAYARDHLPTHPANTVLASITQVDPVTGSATKQVMPATCTTLAESVACFGLTRADCVIHCNIGMSSAWKEDGIDPRYAERQLADNGFRYRDWTAMHVSHHGTQQSRLGCHVVRYDHLHTSVVPWFLHKGAVKWVQVSSTLPSDPRTLHSNYPQASLKQAVEGRFLHDLRLLPTEQGERVAKHNCEIYADESGAVGIVYCPDGSDRLHFICFECKNNID